MWGFGSVVNLGVLVGLRKYIRCHMFAIYLIQFLKALEDITRQV
jgi:hypothetical protein